MNRQDASRVLADWDRADRHVFARRELAKLFTRDNAKAFAEGLNRLVRAKEASTKRPSPSNSASVLGVSLISEPIAPAAGTTRQ
jgi:hypothetical protein